MGVLEIVILSLLGLFLFSTGWLFRISQILVGQLMNFGRSVLANFLKDTLEDTTKQPDTKKKSKKT